MAIGYRFVRFDHGTRQHIFPARFNPASVLYNAAAPRYDTYAVL